MVQEWPRLAKGATQQDSEMNEVEGREKVRDRKGEKMGAGFVC